VSILNRKKKECENKKEKYARGMKRRSSLLCRGGTWTGKEKGRKNKKGRSISIKTSSKNLPAEKLGNAIGRREKKHCPWKGRNASHGSQLEGEGGSQVTEKKPAEGLMKKIKEGIPGFIRFIGFLGREGEGKPGTRRRKSLPGPPPRAKRKNKSDSPT